MDLAGCSPREGHRGGGSQVFSSDSRGLLSSVCGYITAYWTLLLDALLAIPCSNTKIRAVILITQLDMHALEFEPTSD